MLPYACDADLPIAQRYASMKFRLVARNFRLRKVPYEVACELVAFLHIVPLRYAKWIFQWNARTIRRAQVIWDRADVQEDARRSGMIEANLRAATADTGLAILKAMQEGGWAKGHLPPIVMMAIAELNHRGVSAAVLARELQIHPSRVWRAKKVAGLRF